MNDHTKNNLASIQNIPQHLRNAEQALVATIDQGAAELRQIGVAATAAATRFALEVIAAEDRLATACGRIGEIAANLVQQMGELVARMGAMFTTTNTTTNTDALSLEERFPDREAETNLMHSTAISDPEEKAIRKDIRDASNEALANQPEAPVKIGLDAVNHRLNGGDDGTAEQQEQQPYSPQLTADMADSNGDTIHKNFGSNGDVIHPIPPKIARPRGKKGGSA